MESSVAVRDRGFGKTLRRDRWWLPPLGVALGLGFFGGYATWSVLQGGNYFADPYLSPLYSPCIAASCPEQIRLLGIEWWPFSPAILMMGVILGFRGTCYYYRKAYYRAYLLDPPACGVGEFRGDRYAGETRLPWVLQNLHRYFLYASIVIWLFLTYDTIHGFFFEDGFGVGGGSIVLLINLVLLSGYWFGCHSAPPPRRRERRLLFVRAWRQGAVPGVEGRELVQQAPHELGLVQPRLRVRDGPVHPAGRHGRVRRPSTLLTN